MAFFFILSQWYHNGWLMFFDMNVLSQCFFLSKLKSIISYHNVLPTLKNEQKWSISFEQKNNQPSFLQISVISWKSIAHWPTFKRGDLCVCLSRQLGSAGSARSCFTSLPSPGDRLNRNNLEAMVGFTAKNRDLMEFSEIYNEFVWDLYAYLIISHWFVIAKVTT